MPEMCFWAKDEVSEVDTNTAVMTLDGDTVATTVTEPEDGGYRFAYTPSDSLTNGWYQLTVYVEDMAGHMVDSTVDFEVDLNMLGDVDFDDEITTIDANNVLEYAANMHPSWDGTDTLEVADVTGDGNVGAYDAAQIFKYALGVDTTFAPLAKKAAAYASMSFSKAMSTGKEAVVAVPVRIDEARNVYSVEITAEIDPAVVEVSGIETALPDGWMVAQNIEDGVVHLAMAGLEPIKSATIANLKLNVLDKEASAELTGNVVVNENRSKNLESVSIKAIPEEFKLSNNYPNPFNPTTTINYQLPKSSKVVITVYDLLGHRVKTLVNKNMEAGYYSVIWNGKNESGKTLSSGTYFYHIKAGKNSATKKMLLMK
jgi:methionine-rich copper-binding protein CopC